MIYVSDLHLRSQNDEQGQRFLKFLQLCKSEGVHTFILGGDIFDLFVGASGVFRSQFKRIIDAIGALADTGTKVYYLEGNHDFHLQAVFAAHSNVAIQENDFSLEFAGNKIWVSHGDLIDPDDKGYRLLRAITRSAIFTFLIKFIPGFLVHQIGVWSSRKSRNYNNLERLSDGQRKNTRDKFFGFARGMIAQGFDFVLVGHSHLPDEQQLATTGKSGMYINLGFSDQSISYYEITEAGAQVRAYSSRE